MLCVCVLCVSNDVPIYLLFILFIYLLRNQRRYNMYKYKLTERNIRKRFLRFNSQERCWEQTIAVCYLVTYIRQVIMPIARSQITFLYKHRLTNQGQYELSQAQLFIIYFIDLHNRNLVPIQQVNVENCIIMIFTCIASFASGL